MRHMALSTDLVTLVIDLVVLVVGSMVLATDSGVPAVDSMVLAIGSVALAVDTVVLAIDSVALAVHSMALAVDAVVLAIDLVALAVDSMVLAVGSAPHWRKLLTNASFIDGYSIRLRLAATAGSYITSTLSLDIMASTSGVISDGVVWEIQESVCWCVPGLGTPHSSSILLTQSQVEKPWTCSGDRWWKSRRGGCVKSQMGKISAPNAAGNRNRCG